MSQPIITAPELTKILNRWQDGDREALNQLMSTPEIMRKLRQIARSRFSGERPNQTLQPTALVNELYLKLTNKNLHWETRAQFYKMASVTMERLLFDSARRHLADRRSNQNRVYNETGGVEELSGPHQVDCEKVLALHDALDKLKKRDEKTYQVVRLKFWMGLTNDETAGIIDMGEKSVRRKWKAGRSFLERELKNSRV